MFRSPGRVLEITGTVCGIAAMFAVGILSGADVGRMTIDLLSLSLHVVFFTGSLSVIVFTGVVLVTGSVVVRDVWRDGEPDDRVYSGPAVQAILPAYRDPEVLDVSVRSLLEGAYDPLGITIVVEPDDDRTRDRAREIAAERDAVECLVNGNPGSKATAINYAVHRSDADYFAVFDVDQRVTPEFVPTAMGNLLEGADVFQGRRIPRPTGPVETLAYCERIVVHTGYAFGELLGFTNCLSASTVFTREAFERVGGYDDKLTEDIEFAHKCYRADLSVVQDRSCANTMEAPHTLRDLWHQRKRWRIGHVQIFHARIREALEGEIGIDDLMSVGRAAGGIVGGALLLVMVAHVLLLLVLDVASAFLVPFLCVLAVIGAVWLKDASDGHVGLLSWTALLVPLIYLGHGVLTVKAFLEYYITWDGEWYEVTKTGV